MDLFTFVKNNIAILVLLLVALHITSTHAKPKPSNSKPTHTVTIRPYIQNASALTLVLNDSEYKQYESDREEAIKQQQQQRNKSNIDDVDDSGSGSGGDAIDGIQGGSSSSSDVVGKTYFNNENNHSNDVDYIKAADNDTPKIYQSVVQDWLLVCKQLCGAGLGGPACAGQPTCEEIESVASRKYNISERASSLLEDSAAPICQDLCNYQLGGKTCSCSPQPSVIDHLNPNESGDGPLLSRNQICHTFCEHNDMTLTGCSICSQMEKQESAVTDNSATTPNWEQICKELCKSGDGGSLCNCDKPPFF